MVNTQDFLSKIKAGCLSLWKTYGILPSVAAGQAVLESGWGTSTLSQKYNNLFGIKGSYLGNSISLPTTEYYDGKTPVGIVDGFRSYPNWNTSILDYGNFLNVNSRYKNALRIQNAQQQITAIWKAGYATDPNYVSKVMSVINANNLLSWDIEVLNGSTSVTHQPSVNDLRTHVVSYGETFNGIANKYGLSVETLKSLNPEIKDINLIYTGQNIRVSPQNTNVSNVSTYTVKVGDNASTIAKNHNMTLEQLQSLNPQHNGSWNLIHVGEVLNIKRSQNIYTVKSGDTLSGIALKVYGNASDYPKLKVLNNLSSDVIYSGQTLKY